MAEYFHGLTDKGKRRDKNEDTFFVREAVNRQFVVACVIDGVGGYQGGAVAAGIARSVIMKHLEKLSVNVIDCLQRAIVAANAKINQQKKPGGKNERMACVLSCAVIDIKNNKCWWAHVGDTRIYLFRDHSLVKISSDHSAVGYLEESGRLSEEEAMRHPRRNEINKALGFEEDITTADNFIETGESPFLSGDMLLLCSDGLTDMISSSVIIAVLTTQKNIAAKTQGLIDAANEAGGNDNITAVLVENNKPFKQKPISVSVDRKREAILSTAAEPDALPVKANITATKKSRSRMVLLILLFIGLLSLTLVLAFKKNWPQWPKYILPASPNKNEQLIQLRSQANSSAKTVALQGRETLLELTEPILITQDSFNIKGNGATLMPDSLYKGPAFIIEPGVKNIVLDSLVLKNFDVGLMVHKNNLVLKNVRFINCRVPVQYAVLFTDTVISGRFKDSIFISN